MAEGISVLICCYNGAATIEKTLEYLSKQKGVPSNKWEIILVDNSSTDDTANIASNYWQGLDINLPDFKVITEKKPGKINAFKKGILESKFDIVLICDDDNWLTENYLETGNNIIRDDSTIGVLGGKGEAVFEVEQPVWFNTYQGHFAVGTQYYESGNISNVRGWVYGAGCFIRKEIAELLVNYSFVSGSQNSKGNMLRGEDIEMCYFALLNGYTVWYNENLAFKHFVSKSRCTIAYLKRIFEAGARITYSLDGMAYRASANKNWHKTRIQRNWVFRLFRDGLNVKELFNSPYLPFTFLLKIHFIKVLAILKLNFAYDKSFYEN